MRKLLTQPAACTNIENTVLCEISQSQKDTYCMFSLCEAPKVVKFIETDSEIMVARSEVGGGGKTQKVII